MMDDVLIYTVLDENLKNKIRQDINHKDNINKL